MKSPITFKLYLDTRHRDYYEVRIYKTVPEMRRAYTASRSEAMWSGRGRKGPKTMPDALGICAHDDYHIEVLKNGKVVREHRSFHRGIIFLVAKKCGAGYCTHELVHAAHFWVRDDRHVDINTPKGEELLAWTAGYLATQFWTKMWSLVPEAKTHRDPPDVYDEHGKLKAPGT